MKCTTPRREPPRFIPAVKICTTLKPEHDLGPEDLTESRSSGSISTGVWLAQTPSNYYYYYYYY